MPDACSIYRQSDAGHWNQPRPRIVLCRSRSHHAGADIAMTSRDSKSLLTFTDKIHALARKTYSTYLEVRDHGSIQSVVSAIESDFGPIDILVNERGVQCTQAGPRSHLG
jgi:NADP-dependent 3-hydroxy acid dehydrogenase YdfG